MELHFMTFSDGDGPMRPLQDGFFQSVPHLPYDEGLLLWLRILARPEELVPEPRDLRIEVLGPAAELLGELVRPTRPARTDGTLSLALPDLSFREEGRHTLRASFAGATTWLSFSVEVHEPPRRAPLIDITKDLERGRQVLSAWSSADEDGVRSLLEAVLLAHLDGVPRGLVVRRLAQLLGRLAADVAIQEALASGILLEDYEVDALGDGIRAELRRRHWGNDEA